MTNHEFLIKVIIVQVDLNQLTEFDLAMLVNSDDKSTTITHSTLTVHVNIPINCFLRRTCEVK